MSRDETIEQQQHMVTLLRSLRGYPKMTMRQSRTQFPTDATARGPVWISRTHFEAPSELDVRDALYAGVRGLSSPRQRFPAAEKVSVSTVPVEWLGSSADTRAKEPDVSEAEKFYQLDQQATRPLTILYAHGGAYYIGNPCFARPATSKLARITKARVASFAYRLAPENEFPAALLDMFVAYLSLLNPGPNALHGPVSADSIVLASDSAGGNLQFAFVQLLLELHRQGCRTVKFHGCTVPLDLPCGITSLSPFVDYSWELPSKATCRHIDHLLDIGPPYHENWIADDLWPSSPPRCDVYCDSSMFTHPLVNPTLARSWEGSPPMYMVSGEERLLDGIRAIAGLASSQGVPVIFRQYNGL